MCYTLHIAIRADFMQGFYPALAGLRCCDLQHRERHLRWEPNQGHGYLQQFDGISWVSNHRYGLWVAHHGGTYKHHLIMTIITRETTSWNGFYSNY